MGVAYVMLPLPTAQMFQHDRREGISRLTALALAGGGPPTELLSTNQLWRLMEMMMDEMVLGGKSAGGSGSTMRAVRLLPLLEPLAADPSPFPCVLPLLELIAAANPAFALCASAAYRGRRTLPCLPRAAMCSPAPPLRPLRPGCI